MSNPLFIVLSPKLNQKSYHSPQQTLFLMSLIIVTQRFTSAISVSKFSALRTTENTSFTIRHELNTCMNTVEVSAMQTDESTNALNHLFCLQLRERGFKQQFKKFCLNKCFVGHWSMTTYTS